MKWKHLRKIWRKNKDAWFITTQHIPTGTEHKEGGHYSLKEDHQPPVGKRFQIKLIDDSNTCPEKILRTREGYYVYVSCVVPAICQYCGSNINDDGACSYCGCEWYNAAIPSYTGE